MIKSVKGGKVPLRATLVQMLAKTTADDSAYMLIELLAAGADNERPQGAVFIGEDHIAWMTGNYRKVVPFSAIAGVTVVSRAIEAETRGLGGI